MILALIHDWSELATMASAETGGPAIGDWEMARNVSEWIEVVAILVIAIALLVAVVEMARSALRGRGGARAYVGVQDILLSWCPAGSRPPHRRSCSRQRAAGLGSQRAPTSRRSDRATQ